MKATIKVEAISKEYLYSTINASDTIRDSISNLFKRPKSGTARAKKSFYALKNVNFEAYEGEVLGLIGHNGAGKSTLLKILSRVTLPSAGTATLSGRVGSLLEVGTGFHLELTGRENIYLYGAILGMRRSEVNRKFEAIIDFAEIEKFLDTPMKHYSSGMFTRLAFAVASHLESEILLVDEVLAVGDLNFQNKSIKKMEEVTTQGRTVILVSHNMGVLSTLAKRSILLQQGQVAFDGDTAEAVKKYQEISSTTLAKQHTDLAIKKVLLTNGKGTLTNDFQLHDALEVEIEYKSYAKIEKPLIWISITNRYGPLFSATTYLDGQSPVKLGKEGSIKCSFAELPLLPGVYGIEIGIKDKQGHEFLFHAPSQTSFTVSDKNRLDQLGLVGTGRYTWLASEHSAPLYIPYQWRLQ